MRTISWNSRYEIGVGKVDQQHQKLFELIAELRDDYAAGKNGAALRRALDALLDYCLKHFADEEALMESVQFPDLVPHKFEHENLRQAVADYNKRFTEAPAEFDFPGFIDFVTVWIQTHVLVSDMRIRDHVAKRNGAA
ncbi:bacteriohemerythrin [Magnetospira sp. QH-2]|uniref:bacteriohemerythrin n=1 Tax=Magnetospira sp. (strain QH-2) TaxID=1288970 RepID=UPI0003E8103C|nr:bacteriohemerythrin [Magnetospira sp. QH-2]CCQ72253.1 putative Hemerythrin-like metal-binding protein [Magnetospira sp. QH-2]